MTRHERFLYAWKKTGMTQSAFSEAATGKRTHFGTILSRLKLRPDAEVETKTALGIARVSGLRLQWLLDGTGPQAEDGPEGYPAQAAALDMIRSTLSQGTIDALAKAHPEGAVDWSPLDWIAYAADLERERRPKSTRKPGLFTRDVARALTQPEAVRPGRQRG